MPASALMTARSLAVTVLGTVLLTFASYSPAGDRPAGVPDTARCLRIARRKQRAPLKGFGKTRAPCPPGNGEEDREL